MWLKLTYQRKRGERHTVSTMILGPRRLRQHQYHHDHRQKICATLWRLRMHRAIHFTQGDLHTCSAI